MSYPGSIANFPVNVDNVDLVLAADMNDVQTEVTAIEAGLLNGFQHSLLPSGPARNLGAAGAQFQDLFLSRHAAVGGNASVTGNLTVGGSITAASIDPALRTLIQQIQYPVGAIHVSRTDARNPNLILGFGTWVPIAGKVVVGFQAGDPDFGAIGDVAAGAKGVALTEAQTGVHTHGQNPHNHAQDPHATPINDPGHNHVLSDPTHAHGVTDPQHGHSINDPTHSHAGSAYITIAIGGALYASGANTGFRGGSQVDPSPTGITINASPTGVTVNGAPTGITINPVGTGITVGQATATNQPQTAINLPAGGGAAHNNIQPSTVLHMWERTI